MKSSVFYTNCLILPPRPMATPPFCCVTQVEFLYFNSLKYTTKEGNCRGLPHIYISGKPFFGYFLWVIKKVTEKKNILVKKKNLFTRLKGIIPNKDEFSVPLP